MSNNTIGSLLVVVVLCITIFTGLNFVADEVSSNDNLDLKSQEIIFELNNEVVNNYDVASLEGSDAQTELTANSTFEGVDAYARQYLEDKSEMTQKKSTINKILTFPGFIVELAGFDSNPLVIVILDLIILMLGFWIGFAIFKAIKGNVD